MVLDGYCVQTVAEQLYPDQRAVISVMRCDKPIKYTRWIIQGLPYQVIRPKPTHAAPDFLKTLEIRELN